MLTNVLSMVFKRYCLGTYLSLFYDLQICEEEEEEV